MMITEGMGVENTILHITRMPCDICLHSLVMLHHLNMVLDTPDKCRMETMAIEIISSINLIVNTRSTASVNMVEVMGTIGGGIMKIDSLNVFDVITSN
jgi:tRNA(Arg) A34 adenosine deaminase TadA